MPKQDRSEKEPYSAIVQNKSHGTLVALQFESRRQALDYLEQHDFSQDPLMINRWSKEGYIAVQVSNTNSFTLGEVRVDLVPSDEVDTGIPSKDTSCITFE